MKQIYMIGDTVVSYDVIGYIDSKEYKNSIREIISIVEAVFIRLDDGQITYKLSGCSIYMKEIDICGLWDEERKLELQANQKL